jgi:cbb3-type cytochrome oxidase subunit 3
MRLVMEGAGLTFWPALSLVVFVITCLGILAWIYRPGSRQFYRRLGGLPLEDGRGPALSQPQSLPRNDA